jgi:hypothetical protein
MSDATGTEATSCTLPRRDGDTPIAAHGGLLGGGCCNGVDGTSPAPIGRRARRARALAGVGFLTLAGAMGSRRLPGQITLWPAAIVPTWFGISHLVASVTGYRGCPELGAIPSVMLDRPVSTGCGPWERIDRWIGGSPSPSSSC